MILYKIESIGAVGVEILEEQLKLLNNGTQDFSQILLYHLEEIMEMTGVSIFIFALLSYISKNHRSISLNIN